MKDKLTNIIKNNWLFLFLVVVLQIKSMMLLAMLRTPGSAGISLSKMYFGTPAILVHILIIVLISSIIFLFKQKGRLISTIVIDGLVTILFIADIWYYRINGTFLTVRHLMHNELFNPVNGSMFNFKPIDLLFFLDFIVLFIIYKTIKVNYEEENSKLWMRVIKTTIIFGTSAIAIYGAHKYIDVYEKARDKYLFRKSWAPFQTYSDMSPLGYHVFDLMTSRKANITLTEGEKQEIENWFDANKENLPDNKYKGMFKGKNVIALQVESLENFVINQKVYGQEITPTLNKLLSNSLYFNNFYEQNNGGFSSDADFLTNTSMFPIREGSSFMEYPWTNYNTIQKIFNKQGYTTISTHPEVPGNWNWGENHNAFGTDKIWDISKYNVDEVIGLGLSDESYLKQIADKLKNENDPFYAFMVTLTSHGPFDMPEDKKYLKLPKELDETILGAYFQSIRYTDEAIRIFLEELEKNGQLENTVVMIYGDHGGVHKFYQDQLKDVNLEGDWWKADDKKVPLLIYSKDTTGEVISKAGGLVDVLPTISYLVGIDRSEFDNTSMGRVLVNTNRNCTIINSGEIMGEPKSAEEIEHLKKAFRISELIIKGDYFKNK